MPMKNAVETNQALHVSHTYEGKIAPGKAMLHDQPFSTDLYADGLLNNLTLHHDLKSHGLEPFKLDMEAIVLKNRNFTRQLDLDKTKPQAERNRLISKSVKEDTQKLFDKIVEQETTLNKLIDSAEAAVDKFIKPKDVVEILLQDRLIRSYDEETRSAVIQDIIAYPDVCKAMMSCPVSRRKFDLDQELTAKTLRKASIDHALGKDGHDNLNALKAGRDAVVKAGKIALTVRSNMQEIESGQGYMDIQ